MILIFRWTEVIRALLALLFIILAVFAPNGLARLCFSVGFAVQIAHLLVSLTGGGFGNSSDEAHDL